MMLKPFRVRRLYDTEPGVIQITAPQYDQTIKSTPEAALTYLDDDDGDKILVGSAFELEQRLDDPVGGTHIRHHAQPASSGSPTSDMHTFDISHTAASLATWRDHEAYSSKTLRKAASVSPMSGNFAAGPAALFPNVTQPPESTSATHHAAPFSISPRNVQHQKTFSRQRQQLLQQQDVHRKHRQLHNEPESERGLPAQALQAQQAGNPVSIPDSQVTLSKGPTQPECASTPPSVSLQNIIAGAMNGPFADVLETASENLRIASSRARESDVGAIGDILNGFKDIVFEVGKIGKAMIEAFDGEVSTTSQSAAAAASSKVEDIPSSDLTERKRIEREQPKTVKTGSLHIEPILPPQTTVGQHHEATQFPRAETYTSEVPPRGQAHQFPISSQACSQLPEWKTPTCKECMEKTLSCSGRQFASGGRCQNCAYSGQACNFGATVSHSDFTEGWTMPTPKVTHYAPEPSHCDQTHQNIVSGRYHFSPPTSTNARAGNLPCPAPLNPQVQLSTDTAKPLAPSIQPAASRSILDSENTDPDFSAFQSNYPPLMSLRKSKTIGSLAESSRSTFGKSFNTEAAESRYPSVSQLEQESRAALRSTRVTGEPSTLRIAQKADDMNAAADEQKTQIRPRLTLRIDKHDKPNTMPRSEFNRQLPGAWPETRPEADGPTLPTSEHSSAALLNHMASLSPMRINRPSQGGSPEDHQQTAYHHNARLRRSRSLRFPSPLHQPRQVPEGRSAFTPFTQTPQLGRSNTVAGNPAARLTRPFDPVNDALQTSNVASLPRRGLTERHRRRPYHDSFTGAGRTAWELFEDGTGTTGTSQPRRRVRLADRAPQSAGFGIPDKVNDCVSKLRGMGYGEASPHEASRLSIYAAACNGDVVDAVEMIEEDRKALLQHKESGDRMGVRPFSHTERPKFGI